MGLIYGNELLNEQILNEGRVYSNKNDNISITVDGDGITNRGFINDPYFKIYNHASPRKATSVARISLKAPEYIVHNNEKWTLSSKEIKKLNGYLDIKNPDGTTLWDTIKKMTVDELDRSGDSKDFDSIKEEIMSYKKPDYKNLKYRR